MATQARVTSTEALELFRANLIVFVTRARRALADTTDEVRATRGWLEHDRRMHWQSEIRRKTKALEQAQQELMSVNLSKNNEAARMARHAAVAKARRDLSEAEEKLRAVKKWIQNYDSRVEPLAKSTESLSQFLESDMPKAIAYLVQVQNTLDAYIHGTSSAPANAPADAAPAAETEAASP
jgi:chromosome segregation ATPase